MKQGGQSYSSAPCSKSGIRGNHACKICGRRYKQEWSKNIHEKKCQEYEEAHSLKRNNKRSKRKK
jgi:hypothetical protein